MSNLSWRPPADQQAPGLWANRMFQYTGSVQSKLRDSIFFLLSTQERRESTEKGTKTKKTKKAKEKKEQQKPQVTEEEKPQKWRRITVKDVQYDDEVVSFSQRSDK